jgi:hypothetical protein
MLGIDLGPWLLFGGGFGVALVLTCCIFWVAGNASNAPEVYERWGRLARYIVRQQAMKHQLSEDDITWCLGELAKELPFPLVFADADVQGTAEEWFTTWFEYNKNQLVSPVTQESRPGYNW